MSFDVKPFELGPAVLHWLLVVGACALVALFVGSVVSLLTQGARGPKVVIDTLRRGVIDLTQLSPRRILALAGLAIKEAFNRKALYVLFVLAFLFGAANLFLRTPAEDLPAKPYVSFVLTVITWVLIPVALLLACWGLPADIKDRSLHTIVTKPVRRSEIVIGRIVGYGLVATLVLGIIAPLGHLWISRVVPATSQVQLTSRRPIYSTKFDFIDREGKIVRDKQGKTHGVNTGDIWKFREFIEGQTKSRAVWEFTGLNVNELKQLGQLQFEYRMESFRTYKGNIDEGVRFRLTLVNEAKKLRVPFPQSGAGLEIQEFAAERKATRKEDAAKLPIITIPRTLALAPGASDASSVDLFDDLMPEGNLTVEVSCEDAQQFVGAAHPDLFIRLPDAPFYIGYYKNVFTTWLMALLVIMIGTSASCFLKGPVATLLTFGLVIIGQPLRAYMEEQLQQFVDPEAQVIGGGAMESFYRMVTQMNQLSPLPENAATNFIKWCDNWIFNGLGIVKNIIPNFTHYDTTVYVANGFDVPWSDAGPAILPSILTTLGFFIPCVILGYFSLQLRELESK